MISRHYKVPEIPQHMNSHYNYSDLKCNQGDMLRYIGMCVHIASIHSENLS